VNRNFLVLSAVALLSLLAGVLLFNIIQPVDSVATEPAVDAPIELHSIPLTELSGRQTVVGDWQDKILIVNFWAPWCAPCRREIPSLVAIHQEFNARGVQLLGIAFDNEPQVSRFAGDYQINYPLFLAGNRSAMYNAAFGNPSGSLPYTALLDRNLDIIFRHNGELSSEQLREQLDKVL